VTELAFAPALEQARLVREREVSAVELVELYLERIDRLDGELNAFVTVDADGALAQAREPRPGPFSGVPISIKDLHETAGLRTTYSAKAFADFVPDFDAAAVRRLRNAGFVVLGKTNTPELGTLAVTESELNGSCRNPWDTTKTPGGSSGGAAAALAAGLCPVSHGSDGGGSIRIPASCCGVFGLKPSRGRVSPAPWGVGLMSLSVQGPLARTVSDAAALLDVIAGYEPGDGFWAPPPERPFLDAANRRAPRLRFAVVTAAPIAVPVDGACADAAIALADVLADLGHARVDAEPPWAADELVPEFLRIWQTGPATAGIPDLSLLEPINRALAEDALATSSVELGVAVIRLQSFARKVVAFWNDVDVLVTPALALPPVPIGWQFEGETDPRDRFARVYSFTPFTAIFNVTGQPAASVPFGSSPEGLPIGVQLVGKPAGEEELLSLCAEIEEARPWHRRLPRLVT
jgi:amidase